MPELNIKMPQQFKEMFQPQWRHRCWYGGRAGGKTENICNAYLILAQEKKRLFLMTREIQKSIEDSVHRTLKGLIDKYEYPDFTVTQNKIVHKNGSEFIFRGLKTETISSLKSIPDVDYCFVEEAHSVSKRSIEVLIPTIRKEGSQIDWAFNRETPTDPVWTEIVEKADDKTMVKKINSHEREKFLSSTIIAEREKMKRDDPMMYEHVWLGEPLTAKMGSIYGELIAMARDDNRITTVLYNQQYPVYAALDLGWGDSMSIIFAQKVGDRINIFDHYENSEKTTEFYTGVMRDKGYNYEKIYLPHDSRNHDRRSGNTDEDIFRNMGYHQTEVLTRENVDVGINRVRTAFNRLYFDEEKCARLLECLRSYHREWDEKNQLLKTEPKHDWSSHSSDALRYLVAGLETASMHVRPFTPSWVS
jgi:phage terminase large subunit